MNIGLAIPFLPYILYLLLNKDTLNKKHYLFLFFIGLNSSLIHDALSLLLLAPLSFLLKNRNKNLNIYLQIFSVILISSILSDIHLVIGSVVGDPVHREVWNTNNNDIIISFLKVLEDFFTILFNINFKSPLFIFDVP